MPRALHYPSIGFLTCAFILLFLVTVSLPWLPAMDIARVHFEGAGGADDGSQHPLTELRVSSDLFSRSSMLALSTPRAIKQHALTYATSICHRSSSVYGTHPFVNSYLPPCKLTDVV